MAIYHLEAKVVSRGTGRSAVAAAAYMSCSKILNDYDGILHDFTRKRGLVWAKTFLPENAVEENEKAKDSRLAREFVAALPIEMDRSQWIELLTEFIQARFVRDGMCADAAIHDTDGHNPHAHILLTVRPPNPDGTWQYKTQKEYLCIRGKEERGFTAEIKTKTAQQRTLTNEKKQTPAWSLLKKRGLTQLINALAEELEDLSTEKNRILASFDLTDDKDMADIRRWTKQQEAAIQPSTPRNPAAKPS